mgnify:FL=1
MLQRDYLLELISQFVESISKALRIAQSVKEPRMALDAAASVEQDVASLLDMDPAVAMNLSPDSLVTMMVLSGLGESLAEYVAFALMRAADIYERTGDSDTAEFRRAQAHAVAESFGADFNTVPEEFTALVAELDQ